MTRHAYATESNYEADSDSGHAIAELAGSISALDNLKICGFCFSSYEPHGLPRRSMRIAQIRAGPLSLT